MAPLSLKMGFCDSSDRVDILLDYSERTHALEVSGDARYVHEPIARLPDHKFPILSVLQLNSNHRREEIPDDFVAVLPETVVNGVEIPNLRSLTLTNINCPWRALRGLESLVLTRSNDSTSSPLPTFDVLLSMLESCPQLGTLRLDNFIPPTLAQVQYSRVHLPLLTFIYLRDNVFLCTSVLTYVMLRGPEDWRSSTGT